jgi:hypothetical protein
MFEAFILAELDLQTQRVSECCECDGICHLMSSYMQMELNVCKELANAVKQSLPRILQIAVFSRTQLSTLSPQKR